MSKVIRQSGGDSVSISNMAMETFYSRDEIEEMAQHSKDIVAQAKQHANDLQEDARQQAQKIIDQAEKDAENIKAEAKKEGYKKGVEEGNKKVETEFSNVLDKIKKIKQMIDENVDEIFHSVEGQLLELVMEIVKKIIGYEVKANKNILTDIIKKCLSKTKERNHIIVKVNPDDFSMVNDKKDYFLVRVRGLKAIDIEESEAVMQGGCIVETSTGDVNGDIQEQLDNIQEALDGGAARRSKEQGVSSK